jgi:hypothetical protein
MDPISASVVVGLLVKYAEHLADPAAKVLDDATNAVVGKVWNAVRAKFADDQHATSSLDRVSDEPDNPLRQAAVEGYIEEMMGADHEFAVELAQLAQPVLNTTVTASVHNSGAVAAGGEVNISGTFAAGRDMRWPGPAR